MNRVELQQLSRIRLRDAAVLLASKKYPGAYYLAGYAVECALKACVALVQRHDFPDKTLANEAWVHNFEKLMRLTGNWPEFERDMAQNKVLEANWGLVKDWSEADRYEGATSQVEARDLYSAISSRKNGVLKWIRQRW